MCCSFSRCFCLGIAAVLLSGELLGQNPAVSISGNVVDAASGETTLDGTVYDYRAQRFNLPDFVIHFHDTSGDGNVWAWFHAQKTGGRFDANEGLTSSINFSNKADGYTWNLSLTHVVYRVKLDSSPGYADAEVSALGDDASFTGSVQFSVSLKNVAGTIVDSVTVDADLNFNVTLDTSSSVSVSWDEVPQIHLYEDGILPPEGRPPVVTTVPEFNTNTDGTVTNNSDSTQRIKFLADLDQDGDVEEVYELAVEPGQTLPVDMGVDLAAGTFGYWIADGNVTGTGSPTQTSGEDQTLNLNFTNDQFPTDTKLILDNGDLVANELMIGGQIPQQVLSADPGVSESSATFNGPFEITGGTIQHDQTDPDGDRTIVVSVPQTGNTATITGQTGSGGSVTTIVKMPSGNEITVSDTGDDDPDPAINDPVKVPDPGTATTATGADEAAAQLAAIRAEMAAASSSFGQTPQDNGESAALGGVITGISDARNGIQDVIDESGGMNGDFFFLDGDAITAPAIGSVSSWDVPMLGQTFTLNFDLPIVGWFRSFVLVAMSIGWFLGLLHFSKV